MGPILDRRAHRGRERILKCPEELLSDERFRFSKTRFPAA
jgi:hypothetical protein